MGDFNSKLFAYLAKGKCATRETPDNNGNMQQVPVWTDEQLFQIEQSKNDLWEIVMRRAARMMEATGQDVISEERRFVQTHITVTYESKAANQSFNKKHSDGSHQFPNPNVNSVAATNFILTDPNSVGITIEHSVLDLDAKGNPNEISAAIDRFILRGLTCP